MTTSLQNVALELKAVHKSFGRTPIINGVDLAIAQGERHAIIGPNGAGKSTLFNLISGRFHATSESFWQKVRRPGLADPTFNGGYAEVGYLLTDDQAAYKNGVIERVRPKAPLGAGGIGAVQVNARYDWLDLSDAGVSGGHQRTVGVSVIWIPTAYVRFIANYGHMWLDDAALTASGDHSYGVDAAGMRAQFDF